jgi:hypothetical protein
MSYAVRLCPKCPYSPSDLGPHYDPHALRPCCIVCERKSTTAFFPKRPANVRRKVVRHMPEWGDAAAGWMS